MNDMTYDFPQRVPLGSICSPNGVDLYIYTEFGWMDFIEYAMVPPMPPGLAESLDV